MSYGTTRFRRKYKTTRYRRKYTRRYYKPRFGRRRFSKRRGTTSSVVRLSQDATWTLRQNGQDNWLAFSFSPLSLPGFSDYQTTYSHYRILKARLYISRTLGEENDGSQNNYLVVGSRPFAATGSTVGNLLPQPEEALRQTKWQRVHYPNTTTRRVSVGFYPYTMVGTFGPAAVGGGSQWYRIWEAKRWMPFTWANPGTNPTGVKYWGPYLVVDGPYGNLPNSQQYTVQCTLQVSVQFKGQR